MNKTDDYIKNIDFELDDLAAEAGGYVAIPTKESVEYTSLLFELSKKFGIDYYNATPKERAFVEEVTRVTWDVEHGIKSKPSFVA